MVIKLVVNSHCRPWDIPGDGHVVPDVVVVVAFTGRDGSWPYFHSNGESLFHVDLSSRGSPIGAWVIYIKGYPVWVATEGARHVSPDLRLASDEAGTLCFIAVIVTGGGIKGVSRW